MDNSTWMADDELTTTFNYEDLEPPVISKTNRDFFLYYVPPLYTLVFIVGLLGNALVVLILIRFKKLRTMTDIYLLNLAISDMFFIISLPFWAYHSAYEWVFGNAMCKILSGLNRAGFYGGSFFIILLTIDRYLAIVHAVFALKARTVLYGTLSSIIMWVIAALVSVPALILYHVQREDGSLRCHFHYPLGKETEWKQVVNLMMFILGIGIPGVIMVICYFQIVMVLIKGRNERKQKAVRLIFVIVVVYFLLWMPQNIAILLQTYQDSFFSSPSANLENNINLAVEVTEVIAMVHCCLNPVIYAFVGEKFRKYLLIFFLRHMPACFYRLCPSRDRLYLERSTSTCVSTTEQDISTGL